MKITLKGNTSKNKSYFPAADGKPAMLYFDVAEKIKRRDGSETTIWHKVKVARGYADTNYRLLHGEEAVSRYIQLEGHIVEAPKVAPKKDKDSPERTYNVIWADEITYLDNKWPTNESGLPEEAPEEIPDEDVGDDETPW